MDVLKVTCDALNQQRAALMVLICLYNGADCRRMFTNLYICVLVHHHTAEPPAELCDPFKGRSRVSTLSSSPRAKLRSAELEGGQVLDWELAAALSLSHSQYQSLSVSHFLPHLPPSVPHSSHCSQCSRATWQLSPGWLQRRTGCCVPVRRRRRKRGRSTETPDAT